MCKCTRAHGGGKLTMSHKHRLHHCDLGRPCTGTDCTATICGWLPWQPWWLFRKCIVCTTTIWDMWLWNLRSDQMCRIDQTDQTDQTDESDKTDQDKPHRRDRLDGRDRPDKSVRPGRFDTQDRAGRPDRPDRPDRLGRPS